VVDIRIREAKLFEVLINLDSMGTIVLIECFCMMVIYTGFSKLCFTQCFIVIVSDM
jgi:hypothetical protein